MLNAEGFDLVLCFQVSLAKNSDHWCVPIGQYLEASALIDESFDLVHEAVLVYFYWLRDHWCVPIGQYLKASVLIAESFDLVLCFHWLRTVTTGAFLLVNIRRRVLLLKKVLILYMRLSLSTFIG